VEAKQAKPSVKRMAGHFITRSSGDIIRRSGPIRPFVFGGGAEAQFTRHGGQINRSERVLKLYQSAA
jgi:hypothetical protein